MTNKIQSQGYPWRPESLQLIQLVTYTLPPDLYRYTNNHYHRITPLISLYRGVLYLSSGYKWNGCTAVSSGKPLPFYSHAYEIVRPLRGKMVPEWWFPSLIHDALTDIIHTDPSIITREAADKIFYRLLRHHGCSVVRSVIYYIGVRIWSMIQRCPINRTRQST